MSYLLVIQAKHKHKVIEASSIDCIIKKNLIVQYNLFYSLRTNDQRVLQVLSETNNNNNVYFA